MSKQSSIEWLIEQFAIIDKNDPFYRFIISSAKNLHKEEIKSAFNNGMRNSEDWFTDGKTEESQQYYQETYGGNNGSNN